MSNNNEPLFDDEGNVQLLPTVVTQKPNEEPTESITINPERYLTLTVEEQAKLTAPVDKNQIQIKPTGIIYIPWEVTARRLNEVIGIGQWCLYNPKWWRHGNTIAMQATLVVRGCYIDYVYGECEFIEANREMSLMDAVKGAKSDCITNAGKALGVHLELWNPNFIQSWLAEYAVRVWRKSKTTPQWRRKDAIPWADEYTPQTVQVNGQKVIYKTTNTAGRITEAQRRRLFAIAKENGYTAEQVKELIKMHFNLESTEHLTQEQYDKLCGTDTAAGLLTQRREGDNAT